MKKKKCQKNRPDYPTDALIRNGEKYNLNFSSDSPLNSHSKIQNSTLKIYVLQLQKL